MTEVKWKVEDEEKFVQMRRVTWPYWRKVVGVVMFSDVYDSLFEKFYIFGLDGVEFASSFKHDRSPYGTLVLLGLAMHTSNHLAELDEFVRGFRVAHIEAAMRARNIRASSDSAFVYPGAPLFKERDDVITRFFTTPRRIVVADGEFDMPAFVSNPWNGLATTLWSAACEASAFVCTNIGNNFDIPKDAPRGDYAYNGAAHPKVIPDAVLVQASGYIPPRAMPASLEAAHRHALDVLRERALGMPSAHALRRRFQHFQKRANREKLWREPPQSYGAIRPHYGFEVLGAISEERLDGVATRVADVAASLGFTAEGDALSSTEVVDLGGLVTPFFRKTFGYGGTGPMRVMRRRLYTNADFMDSDDVRLHLDIIELPETHRTDATVRSTHLILLRPTESIPFGATGQTHWASPMRANLTLRQLRRELAGRGGPSFLPFGDRRTYDSRTKHWGEFTHIKTTYSSAFLRTMQNPLVLDGPDEPPVVRG